MQILGLGKCFHLSRLSFLRWQRVMMPSSSKSNLCKIGLGTGVVFIVKWKTLKRKTASQPRLCIWANLWGFEICLFSSLKDCDSTFWLPDSGLYFFKNYLEKLIDSKVWNYWYEKGSYVPISYYSFSFEGLGRRTSFCRLFNFFISVFLFGGYFLNGMQKEVW